jgi:hypothetical protein
VYDHLGLCVAANLLLAIPLGLVVSGLLAVGSRLVLLLPAGLIAALGVGWWAAGLWHLTARIAADEEAALGDWMAGLRRHGRASAGMTLALAATAAVLLVNIVFYFWYLPPRAWTQAVGFFWVYAFAFFLLSQVYAYPLLAQTGAGVWEAVKKSFLLTADNLVFTGVLAVVAAGWTALAVAPILYRLPFLAGLSVLVLVAVYFTGLALLAQCALIELKGKYPDRAPAPGDAEPGPGAEVE